MENEKIKTSIRQAIDCVQEFEEPYRAIAFEILLKELLRQGTDLGERPQPRSNLQPTSLPPINEFFSAVHPRAYTDAVVTIAYHLLHGEKLPLFTIQDIADRLAKCRAEKPKNLSDVLAGCARNGWLAEGNQKQGGMKTWYLTATGEKYFQAKLRPSVNEG
ncbi:MAG: hypothetical protein HY282_17575 [Nitrospirae bacterium]|nr:hypothetical protein [Candidatus Manganitrophaceae bacterium]